MSLAVCATGPVPPGCAHGPRILRIWASSGPWTVVTKHHRLGGLKQRKFILSQLWRQKSKTKVLQGHAPSDVSKERSCGLFQLLGAPGVGWLMAVSSSLCLHPHMAIFLPGLCLCPDFPLQAGTPTALYQGSPYSSLTSSKPVYTAETLFPNKVPFTRTRA